MAGNHNDRRKVNNGRHNPDGDRFDIYSRQLAHAKADVEYLDVESQFLKGAASSEVVRL